MGINQRISVVLLVLGLSLIISGCGPGQLFGPTKTPTPTNTPTLTNTPTATITPTPTPLVCEDSISSEILGVIKKASEGLGSNEDLQKHLACAQLVIDRSTELANTQQAAKKKSGCNYKPATNSTKAVNDFNAAYGALNDVGAAWLLKGYALDALGKPDDAQDAYKTAVYNYDCAYLQNPYGGYWSVYLLGYDLIKPTY